VSTSPETLHVTLRSASGRSPGAPSDTTWRRRLLDDLLLFLLVLALGMVVAVLTVLL
jgi:hypothetical protein